MKKARKLASAYEHMKGNSKTSWKYNMEHIVPVHFSPQENFVKVCEWSRENSSVRSLYWSVGARHWIWEVHFEKWTDRNSFEKRAERVLRNRLMGTHWSSTRNLSPASEKEQPYAQVYAGGYSAGKLPSRKDLEVLVEAKLQTSQQCALTTKNVNYILGYSNSSTTSSSTELILSALARPYLECWVYFWAL